MLVGLISIILFTVNGVNGFSKIHTTITNAAAEELRVKLQTIITQGSIEDNVSYTFAVLGDSFNGGEPIAVADGWDDRVTGTKVTNESLIPAGSVTKVFVAVAAIRLHEQGKLDLDEPVVNIVDPWLLAQSLPTLTEMWGGSFSTITSRMLMSMTSGIADYVNDQIQEWTMQHPTMDYLPIQWLTNASKNLTFTPGHGCAYSSNGYVVMGMVLSAIENVSTWQQLDQLKLTGLPLEHTIFMKTGPCSQYPKVVHQYGIIPGHGPRSIKFNTEFDAADILNSNGDVIEDECDGNQIFHNASLAGTVQSSYPMQTWNECCEKAETVSARWGHAPVYFNYVQGNCSLMVNVYTIDPQPGTIAGFAGTKNKPLKPEDFYDLYDESCLNGWTMGNVAIAPQDVVRFYHQLSSHKLINQESLKSMQQWKNFSQGWMVKYMEYGMGLMLPTISQKDVNGKVATHLTHWGHLGEDWGSTMAHVLGYYPLLHASMALGSNAATRMNFTTSKGKSAMECLLQDTVAQYLAPQYPRLDCTKG